MARKVLPELPVLQGLRDRRALLDVLLLAPPDRREQLVLRV